MPHRTQTIDSHDEVRNGRTAWKPSSNFNSRFQQRQQLTPNKLHPNGHSKSYSPSEGGSPGPALPSLNARPKSDTQELAEFLRTSKPSDFGATSLLHGSKSDDHLFTTRKSFRFLRATSSKSTKLKGRYSPKQPIPNVLARKTSRGKPYLHIQVDYASQYLQQVAQRVHDRNDSIATGDYSSCMNYRDSTIASNSVLDMDSTVVSPRPSSADERPQLSPAPWNSPDQVLDSETVEAYQHFLDAERTSGGFEGYTDAKPRSLSIEAVGCDRVRAELAALQMGALVRTPPCSPAYPPSGDGHSVYSNYTTTASPVKVRSRSSSLQTSKQSTKSRRGSSVLLHSDDDSETEREDKSTKSSRRKAPRRPGPPPTRSLPSLPEGHDIASPRAGQDSTARESLSTSDSVVSSDSDTSTEMARRQAKRTAGIYNRFGAKEECGLASREQRVKARKLRDMQRIRRGTSGPSDCENEHPFAFDMPPNAASNVSKPRLQPGFMARRSSIIRRSPLNLEAVKVAIRNGSITPPQSPSLNGHAETGEGLEARLHAVERKNRMLEQALVAVIRGTIEPGRRRGCERASGLEDLLRELRLVDVEGEGLEGVVNGC